MSLDTYRDRLAEMRLGDLFNELISLRMSPTPEGKKQQIEQTQKVHEVVEQINRREVVEKPPKARRKAITKLGGIL